MFCLLAIALVLKLHQLSQLCHMTGSVSGSVKVKNYDWHITYFAFLARISQLYLQ